MRHELRAPLAVIYPLLSMLLDEGAGELGPQQREFLEVLERNVVRLEALITGVADSGWADCSPAPAVPAEVAWATSPRRSSRSAAWTIAEGRWSWSTPGGRPRRARWADRDDVRQIVADLVRNAVTYTPDDGSVTIRVAAGGDPAR